MSDLYHEYASLLASDQHPHLESHAGIGETLHNGLDQEENIISAPKSVDKAVKTKQNISKSVDTAKLDRKHDLKGTNAKETMHAISNAGQEHNTITKSTEKTQFDRKHGVKSTDAKENNNDEISFNAKQLDRDPNLSGVPEAPPDFVDSARVDHTANNQDTESTDDQSGKSIKNQRTVDQQDNDSKICDSELKSTDRDNPHNRSNIVDGLNNLVINQITEETESQVACGPASPLSPSTSFTTTSIKTEGTCILQGLLLCYWDNILGPRIRHLWAINAQTVEAKVLRYIASHTLSGEICREPTDSSVDSKFFEIKQYDVSMLCLVFGAMGKGGQGVHSLCMIVPTNKQGEFMKIYDLCLDTLYRNVMLLRVLLHKKEDEGIENFRQYVQDFVDMLSLLKLYGLPVNVQFMDTFFQPSHQKKIDNTVLRQSITAHLMTAGRSVVIGNDIGVVNLMIGTLGLFVSDKIKLCSCYLRSKTQPFYPSIYIQGIYKKADGYLKYLLKDLYMSDYTAAIIDITTGDVRLSQLAPQVGQCGYKMLSHQIECLWNEKDEEPYPEKDMYSVFIEPETLVTNFIDELYLLPPDYGVRQCYVQQFLMYLQRRALSLIKYAQLETTRTTASLKKSEQKQLKQKLSLTVPGDFKMVLATAERLKPGIYRYVCGDNPDS